MRLRIAILALLLLGAVARAQTAPAATTDWSVDQSASTVTYHLVHKFHKVDGVSHKVDGRARLLPDGTAQVALRIPVVSFDSGNVNRDAHMKEVTEAEKYPLVEIKAVGQGITTPATYPSSESRTFKAQLTFHGVQKMMEIPVKLTFDAQNRVHASTSFAISLDGFKVERPSLMFIKVDDALKLDANLLLKR